MNVPVFDVYDGPNDDTGIAWQFKPGTADDGAVGNAFSGGTAISVHGFTYWNVLWKLLELLEVLLLLGRLWLGRAF